MSALKRLIEEAKSLDLARIAREEFVLMAKVYFAPIYGTFLVIRQVLKEVADQ